MAGLPEQSLWEPLVYQWETTDPVVGGVPNPETGEGMDNIPTLQLANRTLWLKEQIEGIRLYVTDTGRVGSGEAYIENGEIIWEDGINRISNNDGGGNVQLRFGHKVDGSEVFTHDKTAAYIGGTIDADDGSLFLKVASNGGAGDGQPVTWGEALEIQSADIKFGGISISAPIGSEISFTGDTPPPGYLEEDRSTVTRAAYPKLWAHAQASGMLDATGTDTGMFGPGDGVTTFQLPDMRGEFIRGWDNGRGVDAGRLLGSSQGDAIRNIVGAVGPDTGSANQDALFGLDSPNASGAFGKIETNSQRLLGDSTKDNLTQLNFDASRVVPTADENRPRNVARMICIRAY